MRIVIVGPGAMGCLFAGLLAKSGQDVALLDRRPERALQITRDGIQMTGMSGEFHASVQVSVDPLDIGIADLVIICTKAYDTHAAVVIVGPCVEARTILLTLQNGLGNGERLADVFTDNMVLAGTTAHGATLLGPGRVEHTGIGATVIGKVSPPGHSQLYMVKAVLDKAGIETQVTDDLQSALWGKVVINCAINPLAALTRRKNGDLLAESSLDVLLGQVAEEAASVAAAVGITLPYTDAPARVREVCRMTAQNTNSMLSDVLASRQTEIEEITGAVVKAAERAGMNAPLNMALLALVRGVERPNAL